MNDDDVNDNDKTPCYTFTDRKDREWQRKYIKQHQENLKTTQGQLEEAQFWLQRKKLFYLMYRNKPSHPTAVEIRNEISWYENEIIRLQNLLSFVSPPIPPAGF